MPRLPHLILGIATFIALLASARGSQAPSVEKRAWGPLSDGREASLFSLQSPSGVRLRVSDFGATIVGIDVPDRGGSLVDIVTGYDSPAEYESGQACFGATVGRFANRIAEGRFVLDGQERQLDRNSGQHTIHGGKVGFDKRLWTAKTFSQPGRVGVEFTYRSPDGEGGFPGELWVTTTYWLSSSGDIRIEYRATTDQATLCSLTNHAYFNLAGHASGSVLQQKLQINADAFTPTDPDRIPIGTIQTVAGTSLDFRQSIAIGQRLDLDDPLQVDARGFDHNFVLNSGGNTFAQAAKIHDPAGGRAMEIWTDLPGLQFYSANWLGGPGKGGGVYEQRGALCLEPQFFPDAPNHAAFPSAALRPSEIYSRVIELRFGAE